MSLLFQASTKYNLVALDELDSGLDSANRQQYTQVLYRMLPILNIEQLFIISHSIELDATNVDIIKLKSYESYESESGNVIWDYNEIIKGNTI